MDAAYHQYVTVSVICPVQNFSYDPESVEDKGVFLLCSIPIPVYKPE